MYIKWLGHALCMLTVRLLACRSRKAGNRSRWTVDDTRKCMKTLTCGVGPVDQIKLKGWGLRDFPQETVGGKR